MSKTCDSETPVEKQSGVGLVTPVSYLVFKTMNCSLWTCSKSLMPYSIQFINNYTFLLGRLPGPVFLLLFLSPILTEFLKMDWLYLLSVQGTLKSLLQHHRSKPLILLSAFFIAQLSHPYMTTGKTKASTRQIFVSHIASRFFTGEIASPKLSLRETMAHLPGFN